MRTDKFIRLFRMSHVIESEILSINRKLCKSPSDKVVISLTKRYDSLSRRRYIVDFHKQKFSSIH